MSRRTDWSSAERTWQSGKLDRAVASLPPRQGLIMRAMATVHRGLPDDIRVVAEEAEAAGHLDIATMLLVLLSTDERATPTATNDVKRRIKANKRKLNKQAGPLRKADLVTLAQAVFSGKAPRGSNALRDLATKRPGLEGLLEETKTRNRGVFAPRGADRVSQRMWSCLLLAALLRSEHATPILRLKKLSDQVSADLQHGVVGMKDQTPLGRWFRGEIPWNPRMQDRFKAAIKTHGDQVITRAVRRIELDLRHGRGAETTTSIKQIAAIVRARPGLSGLGNQLAAVAARLDTLSPKGPADSKLLQSLWSRFKGSTGARYSVAQAFPRCAFLPGTVLSEGAICCIANEPTMEGRLEVLHQCAPSLDRPALTQALSASKQSAEEQLYLLGVHAAFSGHAVTTLRGARELLVAGTSWKWALELCDLGAQLTKNASKTHRSSRELRQTLEAIEGQLVPLVYLPFLGDLPFEEAQLQRILIRSLTNLSADSPQAQGVALAVSEELHEGKRQELLRSIGRALRRNPSPQRADNDCLHTMVEYVNATMRLFDKTPPDGVVGDSLCAFLQRRSPSARHAAVVRYASSTTRVSALFHLFEEGWLPEPDQVDLLPDVEFRWSWCVDHQTFHSEPRWHAEAHNTDDYSTDDYSLDQADSYMQVFQSLMSSGDLEDGGMKELQRVMRELTNRMGG